VLADYFARSAVAAAQVLDGFDEERFRAHLERTPVGLSGATVTAEADALLDLAVRLLARVYPQLAISVPGPVGARLRRLATAINPAIELVESAKAGIVVGDGEAFADSVFAGSEGWDALVAAAGHQPTGDSQNPFGAGAAACHAASALFRRIFLPDWQDRVDHALRFSVFRGERIAAGEPGPDLPAAFAGEVVLVGAGAIGHGALWALRRLPAKGTVHVVDPEQVELSNLQRYVLADRSDEGALKVELAARGSKGVEIKPYEGQLAEFVAAKGYTWPAMLLALDSARDRVGAQASLPGWIANAWTQPGDLGVSAHSRFGGDGACVGCLYLPAGRVKNEDELVAEALGVPQLLMQIRALLYTGNPVERALLEAVAEAIGQPPATLLAYEGRPIRELYIEGFCGGAVIPLGEAGKPHAAAHDVHVPLAHQSALAGVLLAAALVRHALEGAPAITTVTRVDVLRQLGVHISQPARAVRDGRCICDDPDYRAVFAAKYEGGEAGAS
jgi:hypothetical protein